MRLLAKLVMVVVVGGLGLAALGATVAHRRFTAPGARDAAVTVIVAKGAGLPVIAGQLVAAGLVADRFSFVAGTKWRRLTLRAGEYEFPATASAEAVARQMAEGRTVRHRLTIPEGLTVRQAVELINDSDVLSGTIDKMPAEGSLLPETWMVSRGDDRAELVERMQRAMTREVAQLWARRAADLPLKTPEEAVVLASVVERETGLPAERPMVAGVFVNRLRAGMRLQSDPTVIYGLSAGLGVLDRPLSRADLDSAHPWNTYVIDRLPKGPIANPGRASLEAAMNPARTDALYFVADGGGGHVFARTLDEHIRNVGAWRKVERDRKAKGD